MRLSVSLYNRDFLKIPANFKGIIVKNEFSVNDLICKQNLLSKLLGKALNSTILWKLS